MTKCGVCEENDSKYKCPACRLPYCSLVCYKPHKASHAAQKASGDAEHTQPATQEDSPNPQAETTAPPPRKLADDPALAQLTERYPALKGLLEKVFESTQSPNESAYQKHVQGDKGDERAEKALKSILGRGDLDSEAMQAFIDLVNNPRDHAGS